MKVAVCWLRTLVADTNDSTQASVSHPRSTACLRSDIWGAKAQVRGTWGEQRLHRPNTVFQTND
jgi:hypothetical protein